MANCYVELLGFHIFYISLLTKTERLKSKIRLNNYIPAENLAQICLFSVFEFSNEEKSSMLFVFECQK